MRDLSRALLALAALGGLALGQSSGTTLATLAAQMQPGTWAELSTTGWNNSLLSWPGSASSLLAYTDEAHWDASAKQVLFIGQDHNSNWDSDPATTAKFVRYVDATNAWERLPNIPTSWGPGNIGHQYDGSAFDPARRRFYNRPFNNATIYQYDLAAGSWSALTSFSLASLNITCGLEYFPEMGGLVYFQSGSGAFFYDTGTGQWRTLAAGLGPSTYHEMSEYSPRHKVVLFGGGNGSRMLWKVDASGTVTRLGDAPIGIGITHAIFTQDPVSGKFIVIGKNREFYEYDVTTDAWTPRPGATSPIFSFQSFETCIATPISTYGVILVGEWYYDQSKVFLYKHQASAPPPPDATPPAVAIATPSSSGTATATSTPVALGGTASDNVGVNTITWSNAATGATGTAAGTTNWTASVPLAAGSNAITVTARDGAGNTASATITVTYAPPPSWDTDNDGLPDAWEQQHFQNLNETGSGDPDGDGATNAQEYAAGTDPMDPASVPGGGGAVASSGGGGSGGFCGATGLEMLLVAGFLAALRRLARGRG